MCSCFLAIDGMFLCFVCAATVRAAYLIGLYLAHL